MKKLFTKFLLLAIAMLMGGVNSANAADKEIYTIDLASMSASTNSDIVNLTFKADYAVVGQSGWSYKSGTTTEIGDNVAFARQRSSTKSYGFCWRNKGLFCQSNAYAMTLIGLKTNYKVVIKTSANAITETFKGNYGGTWSSSVNTGNTEYTYIMTSDGDLNVTIAGGAYVYNIAVTELEAQPFDYSINAVDENDNVIKVLKSGMTTEPVTYITSAYIEKDGVYYKANSTSTFSYTANNTNKTVNIPYTTSNISYFIECENMSKSRQPAATLTGTGYSNNVAPRHYSNSYWYTAAFAEGGKFTLYIPYQNNNSSGTTISIYTRDAAGNLKDTGLKMDGVTGSKSFTVENIMIEPGSSLVIYNTNTYNSNLYMDYLTLTKTGDYTVTKTLGTTGFGTFSAACNVAVPAGVVVYNSTLNGETLTATPSEEISVIPANTGVIFKGEPGAEVTFTATAEEGSAIETALTAAPNGVAGDSETIFGLLKNEKTFAKVMPGVSLAENSAYLAITASGKGSINFVIDDDATAADAVEAAQEEIVSVKKFMKNGQLLIETANGLVNAAGAQVK